MKRRIINHWTAGTLIPNKDDLKHYHYLIDGKAVIHEGLYPIEENDSTRDGIYAAHAGGGNTGSIGVALCGMAGFVSPKKPGKNLLTKVQTEALFRLDAELLLKEGWAEATLNNLMTHYEYGKLHPDTSSAGKIDITFLPSYPDVHPDMVGDFIRAKTNWFIQKIKK